MIGVLGATGRIGRHVVAGLADAARPLSRATGVDLDDPRTLTGRLDGCHTLFLLTSHGPDQDLHEAAALNAALTVGVQPVVKLSGGAPSLGPNGVTSTAVAHWRSERQIEASGLGFTFLRSAFLMQNLREQIQGRLLVAPMGQGPIAMVDARDVADCAVAALTHPQAHAQRAYQLTGEVTTYKQAAAALGVRYVNLPPRLAARAVARRMSPWDADHALRMSAYFRNGGDTTHTRHVAEITGRSPRTLDTFAKEQ